MIFNWKLSLFSIISIVYYADTTLNTFKCPDKPAPTAVEIVGCEKAPCFFKTGDNVIAFIKFILRKYKILYSVNSRSLVEYTHIKRCCSILFFKCVVLEKNITSFEPTAVAEIKLLLGVKANIQLPVQDKVGCNHIQPGSTRLECPLQNGDEIIYKFQQNIDENLPRNAKATVVCNALDDQNEVIWCFMVDVETK